MNHKIGGFEVRDSGIRRNDGLGVEILTTLKNLVQSIQEKAIQHEFLKGRCYY